MKIGGAAADVKRDVSVEKGRGYTTPAGQKRFEKLYHILADEDFPRLFLPPAAGKLGVDESVAGPWLSLAFRQEGQHRKVITGDCRYAQAGAQEAIPVRTSWVIVTYSEGGGCARSADTPAAALSRQRGRPAWRGGTPLPPARLGSAAA